MVPPWLRTSVSTSSTGSVTEDTLQKSFVVHPKQSYLKFPISDSKKKPFLVWTRVKSITCRMGGGSEEKMKKNYFSKKKERATDGRSVGGRWLTQRNDEVEWTQRSAQPLPRQANWARHWPNSQRPTHATPRPPPGECLRVRDVGSRRSRCVVGFICWFPPPPPPLLSQFCFVPLRCWMAAFTRRRFLILERRIDRPWRFSSNVTCLTQPNRTPLTLAKTSAPTRRVERPSSVA